jgi:hypothetical protein
MEWADKLAGIMVHMDKQDLAEYLMDKCLPRTGTVEDGSLLDAALRLRGGEFSEAKKKAAGTMKVRPKRGRSMRGRFS